MTAANHLAGFAHPSLTAPAVTDRRYSPADGPLDEVEGQPGVGYEIYKDEMGLRLRITSTAPAPTP